jgi:hypothetical protein
MSHIVTTRYNNVTSMATALLGNGLVNTSRPNTRTEQQNYECL